jgi:hypothetical protein
MKSYVLKATLADGTVWKLFMVAGARLRGDIDFRSGSGAHFDITLALPVRMIVGPAGAMPPLTFDYEVVAMEMTENPSGKV